MDLKRIALFNGSCTASSRIEIRGQLVDTPVLPDDVGEKWDPYLGLTPPGIRRIRPIHDLRLRGVGYPILQLEILDHPGRIHSKESIENASVLYRSNPFVGGWDGCFSHRVEIPLTAGHYSVRVVPLGNRSPYQKLRERYHNIADRTEKPVGHGKIRILPDDYSGVILTSDIDQTFLDTDLETKHGLLATLFETPDRKKPLPGMVEFYREFRGVGDDPLPLLFLSASPQFFRRTFQALFEYHNIDYTGLSLKRFSGVVEPLLMQMLSSMRHPGKAIVSGIERVIRRTPGFFANSVDGLFHQVSYKLIILLENRLNQPTGASEILMGDNTESDFLTFALYQLLISGRLGFGELEDFIKQLRFHGKRAISGVHGNIVLDLTRRNLKIHGRVNPVKHTWINRAYDTTSHEDILKHLNETLPPWSKESERIIERMITCDGAGGFAEAANQSGYMSEDSVLRIQKIIQSNPEA